MKQSKAAAIIIGANGGIGSAILKRIHADQSITTIFALSRNKTQTDECKPKVEHCVATNGWHPQFNSGLL